MSNRARAPRALVNSSSQRRLSRSYSCPRCTCRRSCASRPNRSDSSFKQVYRHFNRALIQFDASCAQYDPELAYTLKPGVCTFANVEFTNEVRVNHLGVRDDEASLVAPDVIVIGDSHAMGWGVDQGATLPRVLAQKSGLKVLNAGSHRTAQCVS